MVYRKIDMETKKEAVRRVLRGEMITVVAADTGTDRNSLAIWVNRVMAALDDRLGRKKRERRSSLDRTMKKFVRGVKRK